MIVIESSTSPGVPLREEGVIIEVDALPTEATPTKEDHMARTRKQQPQVEETPVETPEPEAEQPKQRTPREVGPATQKVIDSIRVMYEDEGLGFPSIAKRLNEQGIKTFRGGETWHPPVVRGICLRNGWTKGDKKQTTEKTNES